MNRIDRLRHDVRDTRRCLDGYGDALRSTVRVGIVRTLWMFRRERFVMAHMSGFDAKAFPWGAPWVKVPGVGRVCACCRTHHPVDVMDALSGLTRWNQRAADEERSRLIERGEVENCSRMAHFMSVTHPMPGTMVVSVTMDGGSTVIHFHAAIENAECRTYAIRIDHLQEMAHHHVKAVLDWLDDLLVEVSVSTDEKDGGFRFEYDPALTPNLLPRPTPGGGLFAIMTQPPESDEDDEP